MKYLFFLIPFLLLVPLNAYAVHGGANYFYNQTDNQDSYFLDNTNNDDCDNYSSTNQTSDQQFAGIWAFPFPTSQDCYLTDFEFDITELRSIHAIQPITISSFALSLEIPPLLFCRESSTCQAMHFVQSDRQPSTRTDSQRFDEVRDEATLYDTLNANDYNTANGTIIAHFFFGQAVSDLQAKFGTADDWFSIGLRPSIMDVGGVVRGIQYFDGVQGTNLKPTLTIAYTVQADAPEDTTAISSFFSTSTLDWVTPNAFNETIVGYQIFRNINTTFPATTVIVNDTGTTQSAYFDSGLTALQNYTYRVGTWIHLGNVNTSGNNVNVTTPDDFTQANFTAGFFTINATSPIDLQIRFNEVDFNSTRTILNVIYSRHLEDLSCTFDFQFAQNSLTFSNLDSTVFDANFNQTSFNFDDVENEIIDINCVDGNTNTTATYLITQTNIPIITQMQRFQSGEFGTSGQFGSLDLVTLSIIIVAMIGFNRINESVGIIFAIALLGAMTFFGLIAIPTIISGAVAITVMMVIATTRKK